MGTRGVEDICLDIMYNKNDTNDTILRRTIYQNFVVENK